MLKTLWILLVIMEGRTPPFPLMANTEQECLKSKEELEHEQIYGVCVLVPVTERDFNPKPGTYVQDGDRTNVKSSTVADSTSIPIPQWAMKPHNLVFFGDKGPYVTLHPDATVRIEPGVTLDAAATAFWASVSKLNGTCPAH